MAYANCKDDVLRARQIHALVGGGVGMKCSHPDGSVLTLWKYISGKLMCASGFCELCGKKCQYNPTKGFWVFEK